MKSKRLFMMVLTLCAGVPTLSAQGMLPDRSRDTQIHQNVFGLGLAGGAMSGVGLSFRHHLPSEISYQIVGGIIKVDQRLSYSIGTEIQFDLVRSALTRFYAGGGAGYYYSGSSSHNDMDGPGRLGIGIGGEYASGPNLNIGAELMFTYFSDGTVLPLPQIGIHYYFY